jgi:NAD(P)-dependent dehydrogenase (short-subunit alcohol dehydrogenase family)
MILFPADAFGLDPLSPPAGEVSPWRDGEVLLTGAAGLLGSALLERLLNLTNATVHCLVRPTAEATAEHRLRDVLEGLGHAVPDDRCRVVEGDLAAPRLGLDAESHARLADRVDLILHVGAKVAWWGDVSEIRATNLDGVRSIVDLAATGRPKWRCSTPTPTETGMSCSRRRWPTIPKGCGRPTSSRSGAASGSAARPQHTACPQAL